MSTGDLRKEYTRHTLVEGDLAADPFQQFRVWFQNALDAGVLEPNAMTLATSTKEGRPSARIVLLKDMDDRSFTFHTNYASRKGSEIGENPAVAAVFFWPELERQVRIEGIVEKATEAESDAYFRSRPAASRYGAWASDQSEIVAGREDLERGLKKAMETYPESQIPRPPHWGGYRILPSCIEFWQGRPSRLHDRLRYRLVDTGNWVIERLAP